MDQSEVWWADLPPPVGRRPVLILTRSSAVTTRDQVVIAQVTRTARRLASEVPLTRRDGLPKDCVVNGDVLLTVPASRLIQRITRLSRRKFAIDIS